MTKITKITYGGKRLTIDEKIAENKIKILEAYKKTDCNVNDSCKAAGVTCQTYHNYKNSDPDFAKKIKECKSLTVKNSHLKERILEVYKLKNCHISKTCSEVSISRNAFYELRKNDKDFAKKLDECKENLIDEVEDKFLETAKSGNLKAMIFFLKTKGRYRGYDEKIELRHKTGYHPVKIVPRAQLLLPEKEKE